MTDSLRSSGSSSGSSEGDNAFTLKAVAGKSFDKSGKVIQKSSSALRMKIEGVADDRLLIAVKNPKDGVLQQSFLDKRKYLPLKLSDDKTILVNISSLASRLHLTEKEIKNNYMSQGGLNKELIQKRAAEVQNKLKEYDNLVAQHSSAEVTALKISKKDFEKFVRKAITLDLTKGTKIKVGSLFNRVKILVARDSTQASKPLLLLTKVKVLGYGSYGKVSELRNLASPQEELVSKRPTLNDYHGKFIHNEVYMLNYLWSGRSSKTPITGIQPPPKAVYEMAKQDRLKVGFIIPKHDGDLSSLLKDDTHKMSMATRENGVKQLVEGLYFMQKKGVLHGDIKPDNIGCKFQDENDPSKIQFFFADFGGAQKMSDKALDIKANPKLQKSPGGIYTPYYMCARTTLALSDTAKKGSNATTDKEIKNAQKEFTKLQEKRDVYATGLSLYTLLTGNPDPLLNSYEEVSTSKILEDLTVAGVSQNVKDVVMGMLEPDPNKRMTSREARKKLREVGADAEMAPTIT